MEEALVALLLQSAGVTAYAGTRITWGLRDQGHPLPAITLSVVFGSPYYADEGEVGLSDFRVQVDCWALSRPQTILLGRGVLDVLSGAHVTVGSVNFQAIWNEQMQDLEEEGAGAEPVLFRRSLEFQLSHSEA